MRLGPVGVIAPQTGIDSNQGKVIATPAPRKTVRRVICFDGFIGLTTLLLKAKVTTALIQERGTGYDGFDQAKKAIIVFFEICFHFIKQQIV